jgi:hypothetical protein
MRLFRLSVLVLVVGLGGGCGGSSGPKEEKPLPANRVPKVTPVPPKK